MFTFESLSLFQDVLISTFYRSYLKSRICVEKIYRDNFGDFYSCIGKLVIQSNPSAEET